MKLIGEPGPGWLSEDGITLSVGESVKNFLLCLYDPLNCYVAPKFINETYLISGENDITFFSGRVVAKSKYFLDKLPENHFTRAFAEEEFPREQFLTIDAGVPITIEFLRKPYFREVKLGDFLSGWGGLYFHFDTSTTDSGVVGDFDYREKFQLTGRVEEIKLISADAGEGKVPGSVTKVSDINFNEIDKKKCISEENGHGEYELVNKIDYLIYLTIDVDSIKE